jgi:TolB protein
MEVSCDAWPLHRLADDITLYLTGIPGCAATRIAFVRADGPVKELHLVDADGRNQEVVTALRSIVLSPAWDAEGSRLAFTTFHRGGPQLVALRLADGRMSTLCGRGTPGAAAYSPDGRWIAYSSTETGDAEIFVARADGSEPRRLTFHPAIDTSPGWAPSGQRLVFTSDRTGTPQLFLADADGVHLDQITFDGDWNDSPDWSRRGNRIVHVCLIDKRFELALIRPDGSGWQRLTTGGGCENPTWAPDGRHVVFARSQGGSRSLWVLDADTGSLRPLTAATSQTYNPAWSPSMRERIRASGRAE